MRKGLSYSASLHIILLLLVAVGIPYCSLTKPKPEPYAVTVEILPITSQTNIKPSEVTPQKVEKEEPKKAPEPVKPEPPKPVQDKKTNEKDVTPTKSEEAAPPKKEEVPLPDKKIVKKEEKPDKKDKKDKKKEEDTLDAVLKSVKKLSDSAETKPDKVDKKANKAASKSKSENYNPMLPLSMSEKDAIKNQISSQWNPPTGARDAQNLLVTLRITVNPDGTVTEVEIMDRGRYNSDSFFRSAVDSAVRAVWLASPLKNLPGDKYDSWKDIELTFDPHELLY